MSCEEPAPLNSGDKPVTAIAGFLGAAISGSHVGMWIPAVFWLQESYLIAKNHPTEPPFDWKLNINSIRGLTIDDEHCRLSIITRDRQGWEIRGLDYLWDRWSDLVDQIGQFHEIERIVMHGDGKVEDQIVQMAEGQRSGSLSRSRRSSRGCRRSSRESSNVSPTRSSSRRSVSKQSAFSSSSGGASVPMMDVQPAKQVSQQTLNNTATLNKTVENAMAKTTAPSLTMQGKKNTTDNTMNPDQEVAVSKELPMAWLTSLGKVYGKYEPLLLKHGLQESNLRDILLNKGPSQLKTDLAEAGVTSALHQKRICFEVERRAK